jgi:hypothetical protein
MGKVQSPVARLQRSAQVFSLQRLVLKFLSTFEHEIAAREMG